MSATVRTKRTVMLLNQYHKPQKMYLLANGRYYCVTDLVRYDYDLGFGDTLLSNRVWFMANDVYDDTPVMMSTGSVMLFRVSKKPVRYKYDPKLFVDADELSTLDDSVVNLPVAMNIRGIPKTRNRGFTYLMLVPADVRPVSVTITTVSYQGNNENRETLSSMFEVIGSSPSDLMNRWKLDSDNSWLVDFAFAVFTISDCDSTSVDNVSLVVNGTNGETVSYSIMGSVLPPVRVHSGFSDTSDFVRDDVSDTDDKNSDESISLYESTSST